jgi:hypothetical protein
VKQSDRSEAARLLGKLSYAARLKKYGAKKLSKMGKRYGKLGGRPPKKGKPGKGERDAR